MDKIICVGKNYLKHAVELGDAVPTEPLYFLKPPSTIVVGDPSAAVVLPAGQGEVHHEVELVLKIAEKQNAFYYSHFTIGLDLTLRQLQAHLKKSGQPWEKSKVFRNSSILGRWIPITNLEQVLALPFGLMVNGEWRQKGVGQDMRFQPAELLADVQKWFPVVDGDVLFTGTPEGVGPLKSGDKLQIFSGDQPLYTIDIN